jgi:hypothetical protein
VKQTESLRCSKRERTTQLKERGVHELPFGTVEGFVMTHRTGEPLILRDLHRGILAKYPQGHRSLIGICRIITQRGRIINAVHYKFLNHRPKATASIMHFSMTVDTAREEKTMTRADLIEAKRHKTCTLACTVA